MWSKCLVGGVRERQLHFGVDVAYGVPGSLNLHSYPDKNTAFPIPI